VLFQKPIKRKNAFFCSQFVASVLKESKVIDFEDEDLSLVKPSDLTYLANFELLFEGGLTDYQRDIIDEEIQVPCQLVPIKM
jgi:hypothetical protein